MTVCNWNDNVMLVLLCRMSSYGVEGLSPMKIRTLSKGAIVIVVCVLSQHIRLTVAVCSVVTSRGRPHLWHHSFRDSTLYRFSATILGILLRSWNTTFHCTSLLFVPLASHSVWRV
jgi:hypothetical protein